MMTPEQALWLAVLVRAVDDATQTEESIRAAAARQIADDERKRERRGYKEVYNKASRSKALMTADATRSAARAWLTAGKDVVVVADYAGLDGPHVVRMVQRLQRNDWRPIGVELGEALDKLAVRDRQLAR
jgi:hypothetical protein